jgi:hypothetical protein
MTNIIFFPVCNFLTIPTIAKEGKMDGVDTDAIFFIEMEDLYRRGYTEPRQDNPPETDTQYHLRTSGMFLRDEVIPMSSRFFVSSSSFSSHELRWVVQRGE